MIIGWRDANETLRGTVSHMVQKTLSSGSVFVSVFGYKKQTNKKNRCYINRQAHTLSKIMKKVKKENERHSHRRSNNGCSV